jgi:hypothetical protein
MKLVITVTAVYDFPDDVELEDLIEGEESLGKHILINDRKFQPYIDFLEYDGIDEGAKMWTEADEEELDGILDDSLDSEEYTIIQLDGLGDEDDDDD